MCPSWTIGQNPRMMSDMGRLIDRPAVVRESPPANIPAGKRCTTCQINYPANTDHTPDSQDCIEAADEKRWSQSDW